MDDVIVTFARILPPVHVSVCLMQTLELPLNFNLKPQKYPYLSYHAVIIAMKCLISPQLAGRTQYTPRYPGASCSQSASQGPNRHVSRR